MFTSINRLARRAALGLLAVATLAASPAAAEPALWAIRDKDSTIYLFGTVHALKPSVQWRSDKVAKALGEAQELVVEVVGADDPAAMQPLIMKYGIDTTSTLTAKVGAADAKRIADAAAKAGLPPQALEPMRPWLVSVTLAVLPMMQAGYDPTKGVESLLQADAKAAGKPINGLETLEQQIRFFADLPQPVEVGLLRSTLDDVAEGPAQLDKLVDAWSTGDQVRLESAFIGEMKSKYPEVYKVILAQRNADWARQLKAKLDGKGVSFVAVGTGHLVGPDSVQAELAKLGVKAERR